MAKNGINVLQGRVHFSLGMTKNMGEYNSVRFDVGVSMDVPDIADKTISAAIERCRAMCIVKANQQLQRLKK